MVDEELHFKTILRRKNAAKARIYRKSVIDDKKSKRLKTALKENGTFDKRRGNDSTALRIPLSELSPNILNDGRATTLKFAVSKYGWFYYGCTRCSSKAPNPEKAYECSCGQKVEQPIPRYKIEIYVSNGESKYRFVFSDSECAAILGMTAEFMHNSMVENGEDDPMVYPDELEMLLNKKMAFRVKVQPTFSQASVWKLCDDEAFVKEIENDYIVEDNQSKTEYAKLVPNKENLETSAQTLSASGENDPESIILMTPAKDVVIADKGEEVDFEASGATQLSGTKPSKKLKIEPSS
ncbi:hypothetical protein KIW84_056757 [Lathyrus oleraceus]|uniref:Replication factor A C-terminal domain-containing protein n=1 Tax=Pisum sativum TaxID=3888 RepID=A0A9D4X431_PEA|nr:hypothetical protein KIW84_056757 [Pisum sativum]